MFKAWTESPGPAMGKHFTAHENPIIVDGKIIIDGEHLRAAGVLD
ncbi:hypothetical protein [Solihabitans fulvus]|nr:hypothetical protein [Solihabitans fulvus]